MKKVLIILALVIGIAMITVPTILKIIEDDSAKSPSTNEPSTSEPSNPTVPENTFVEPNKPELLNNMVPIKYNGSNWVYADIEEKWYDYESKEWANAVVLNSGVTKSIGDTITEDEIALWYVWIPRYKYTIFNGQDDEGVLNPRLIEITFENGTNSTGTVSCIDNINQNTTSSEICSDEANGKVVNGVSTYTHPAFTFGEQELTGIWIGKFEVSGTQNRITIKPNVQPLADITLSNFFYAIQDLNSVYGIDNVDSHMIKNMEWGAVAYLSHSKYGLGLTEIGVNNYFDEYYELEYKTGCGASDKSISDSVDCNTYDTIEGMSASTTGNIYGIYDMSGGILEYVMGNMADANGNFSVGNSGFTTMPDSKYYDIYTYDTNHVSHGRGKLGDAMKETLVKYGDLLGSWYDEYAVFAYDDDVWFNRGSSASLSEWAGLFAIGSNDGNSRYNRGTRSVLVVTNY